MPIVNFDQLNDSNEFLPLPEGWYHCRIDDVKERISSNGNEMWTVRFEVVDGKHMGKYIFCNLVFRGVGLQRIKHLCSALNIKTRGDIKLMPDSILDQSCFIEVEIENFTDKQGQTRTGNRISFAGFKKEMPREVGEITSKAGDDLDDIF